MNRADDSPEQLSQIIQLTSLKSCSVLVSYPPPIVCADGNARFCKEEM